MPELLTALTSAAKHCVADHPHVPNTPGIYLFRDADTAIYVGQSRKLRERLRLRTGATRRQEEASFAFNVAKREAKEAGVDIERWRAVLQADADFRPHFDNARAKVAAMHVQFIGLADPIERTLFEVYAALALGTTEFNSFETH
jgi:hypothetical protein